MYSVLGTRKNEFRSAPAPHLHVDRELVRGYLPLTSNTKPSWKEVVLRLQYLQLSTNGSLGALQKPLSILVYLL